MYKYVQLQEEILKCKNQLGRMLEEGHIRRQAQWKKAKSNDLLAMHQQDTTGVVTVHRPLKRHRAGKKVAPPGIEPRKSGFSLLGVGHYGQSCGTKQ